MDNKVVIHRNSVDNKNNFHEKTNRLSTIIRAALVKGRPVDCHEKRLDVNPTFFHLHFIEGIRKLRIIQKERRGREGKALTSKREVRYACLCFKINTISLIKKLYIKFKKDIDILMCNSYN